MSLGWIVTRLAWMAHKLVSMIERQGRVSDLVRDLDDMCRWLTLEERDEVSLGRLLESHDGGGLEPQVGLEVLSDFCEAKARELVEARSTYSIVSSK